MKNVSAFLKRHSALLLLVLVLATVPAGIAFGKYVKELNVTNGISVDVQMKEYRLEERMGMQLYIDLKVNGSNPYKNPDTFSICKHSELPDGVEPYKTSDGKYIDLKADDESGSIYVYIDENDSGYDIYIAPADSDAVIYAPANGQYMLSYQGNSIPDLGYRILDASNLDTSRCNDMNRLFYDMEQVESIDMSGFDTSHVTDVNLMFFDCKKLRTINFGSGFKTGEVKNMNGMFSGCAVLSSIDISGFDTTNVTNMGSMFHSAEQLRSITFGDNFDTSAVTDMNNMFYSCKSLGNIDLSNFNTSNVTDMHDMFGYTNALSSIDLSRFDTSKVTSMEMMFYHTGVTSLDLSKFDTGNVTNMKSMFSWSQSLKTIYVSDKFVTDKVPADSSLFWENGALTGGSGTRFAWGKGGVQYARIDGGPDSETPGYFTDINGKSTQSAIGSIDASGISLVS